MTTPYRLPNGAVATKSEAVNELISRLPASAFRHNRTKFTPKLNVPARMAIRGLVAMGVGHRVLAIAYEVDRRTIGHIANDHSLHYRDVSKEWQKLGEVDFIQTYVTSDDIERCARILASDDPAIQEKLRLNKNEASSSTVDNPAKAPNPRANKNAGLNVVKTENTRHSHRLIIEFRDDQPFGVGWYYQDMDDADPTAWYHNGEESMLTSTACLEGVIANLVD